MFYNRSLTRLPDKQAESLETDGGRKLLWGILTVLGHSSDITVFHHTFQFSLLSRAISHVNYNYY